MTKLPIILTAFLLSQVQTRAQPTWRIDQLSVADGLSQGYIYAVLQDKKGFIWIGTHGGLNRYDGYSFRVFQYSPFDATTLGDNAVFFIKEDSLTGKFWIGGSATLNEFDPGSFTNTRYRYPQKQTEFSDGIFLNQHELLLACEYTVLLFDTRRKKFTEIPVYNENGEKVSISRVENIARDRNGHHMIMSRTGVFFYDPFSKSCQRKIPSGPDFSKFYDHEVFHVLHDSRGYYWIATNKKGLIRFDARNNQTLTIPMPSPLKNEALRFDVVMEDSRGEIWAGSSHGLFRVDTSAWTATYFSSDQQGKNPIAIGSLSHDEINVIAEDRNHIMWIGTVGGGINKLIRQHAGFRHFSLPENSPGMQTGSYIMALRQWGTDIWFSNIWDQVGRINMQSGEAEFLRTPMLPAGYSWYSEGAIVELAAGELAVLNGESIVRITRKQGGKLASHSHASPGLSYVHHAANGKTWYMVKAPVANTFQRNDTIYGNQFFFDAKDDNKGHIWIGSSRGLVRFDIAKNKLDHYQHDDRDRNSISSDLIYALEIDAKNETIWMAAYNGGLCSFHIPTGNFRHYTREDGLSDNIVYSMEKDKHGNLWFSSNAGISAYNTTTKTFRNYTVADGLLNHEFNRRASFANEQGWLYFGGIAGIDYFHPDSIVKTSAQPKLVFTGFRLFNNDILPGERNNRPVIELRPNDRHVTIDFSSLDFHDQQKIQYAYRINDKDWIKTGKLHTLSFSNLSTGTHHLSIRSTNSDGTWLNNEIACLIIVHPRWWQTGWFRGAVGLLALGLLLGGIRLYYRRKMEKQKIILERQQAIEKERTRIATDMHDDLGAGLSRIKFLSETIGIKKQMQESIEEEVGSIRNYSHEMIDKMGEIVWALNEKNDSLVDLVAYTRAYMVEYLSQNGIQSQVQINEEVPNLFVSGEFRRNIYLTVKEALHNIVKHAQASRVTISIETADRLFITIQDNGQGFDEMNIRPYSNGISNMKKRIASLGGQFAIRNGQGSTVTLEVPLP